MWSRSEANAVEMVSELIALSNENTWLTCSQEVVESISCKIARMTLSQDFRMTENCTICDYFC